MSKHEKHVQKRGKGGDHTWSCIPSEVGRGKSPRSSDSFLIRRITFICRFVRIWWGDEEAFKGVYSAEMQENQPLKVNRTYLRGHLVGHGVEREGEKMHGDGGGEFEEVKGGGKSVHLEWRMGRVGEDKTK